jgi:Fe2+ or Zn2+ uptake regulation protein
MEDAKKNLIKVVQKAVQIMKILENSPQPMGVNELGKLAAMPPATVYRILRTLHRVQNIQYGPEVQLCGFEGDRLLSDEKIFPR